MLPKGKRANRERAWATSPSRSWRSAGTWCCSRKVALFSASRMNLLLTIRCAVQGDACTRPGSDRPHRLGPLPPPVYDLKAMVW
jgi:hypothetical protein